MGQSPRVKLGKLHAVNRTRWSKTIKPSREVKEARSKDEAERKRRKLDLDHGPWTMVHRPWSVDHDCGGLTGTPVRMGSSTTGG